MEKGENEEIKYATETDLTKLVKAVRGYVDAKFDEMREAVCALRSEMAQPKELQTHFYRCSEKGCDLVTDDLAKFAEHVIDEKLRKLGFAPEETVWEAPKPVKRHKNATEHLDCPDCYPQFEKELLDMGRKKPEPEPKKMVI